MTGDREVGEAGGQQGAPAQASGKPWGPSQGGGRKEVDGLPGCQDVDSGGRGDGLDSRDEEEEAGWSPPGAWVPLPPWHSQGDPELSLKLWWLWVAFHQQGAPRAMVTTRGQDFGGS